MKNPIVSATIKLLRAVRNADKETLKEAFDKLHAFGESWLVEGTMEPLAGAHDSCLADTDLTEPIKEVLEIRADEAET